METARKINRLGMFRRFLTSPLFKLAAILLLVLALASIFFVKRSFLVVAETSFADITFSGEVNTWTFPNAALCAPLDIPDLDADPAADPVCNPQLFSRLDPGGVAEVTLNWACGARVTVQSDGDERLVVTTFPHEAVERQAAPCRGEGDTSRALATGYDFAPGTILVVEPGDWRRTGALAFQGEATIGEAIGPGAIHFLQSGRWEARQTSPILDALRVHRVTEVIKSGDFSVGAEVTIFDDNAPAIVAGHITPTPVDPVNSLPGFDVVMLSAPGRQTELELVHYGFAEPARLRPDWVDTAITSPLFLAVFAMLNLVAVLIGMVKDWPTRKASEEE